MLKGNAALSPVDHILRHYPFLNADHARRKYVNRRFAEKDLRRGWHGNRVGITAEELTLPKESDLLHRLESHESKNFRRDRPARAHFWMWHKASLDNSP